LVRGAHDSPNYSASQKVRGQQNRVPQGLWIQLPPRPIVKK